MSLKGNITKLVINGKAFEVQGDPYQILRVGGQARTTPPSRLDIKINVEEMINLKTLLTELIAGKCEESKIDPLERKEVALYETTVIYGRKMKCVLGEACSPCKVKDFGEGMCKHIKCKRMERSDKCGVHFIFANHNLIA